MDKRINRYDHLRRLDLLENKTVLKDKEKLIYEWVKSNHINFAEFRILLERINPDETKKILL